jgi:hypothetical protein
VNEFGFIVDENGNPSMRFEIARATLEWLGNWLHPLHLNQPARPE